MNGAKKLVYLMVGEEERGPFTLEQVRMFCEVGVITPDTMFKETEEWRPLLNAMSGVWQPSEPLARCFLRASGEERGPFLFDQIRRMWRQGQITPDAKYKLGEVWEPVARVLTAAG